MRLRCVGGCGGVGGGAFRRVTPRHQRDAGCRGGEPVADRFRLLCVCIAATATRRTSRSSSRDTAAVSLVRPLLLCIVVWRTLGRVCSHSAAVLCVPIPFSVQTPRSAFTMWARSVRRCSTSPRSCTWCLTSSSRCVSAASLPLRPLVRACGAAQPVLIAAPRCWIAAVVGGP
jgi:hypothetical protein